MEVNLAHSFEPSDVEGIGAQQLAGATALHVSFAKTRIDLLDLRHLFSAQPDRLLRCLLF